MDGDDPKSALWRQVIGELTTVGSRVDAMDASVKRLATVVEGDPPLVVQLERHKAQHETLRQMVERQGREIEALQTWREEASARAAERTRSLDALQRDVTVLRETQAEIKTKVGTLDTAREDARVGQVGVSVKTAIMWAIIAAVGMALLTTGIGLAVWAIKTPPAATTPATGGGK